MNQKQIQKALDNDLKKVLKAEDELDDLTFSLEIEKIMAAIENQRESLMNVVPQNFTQEHIAKKGGISRSTYRSYAKEGNNNITLKTLLKLANALEMKCSIILESSK